MTRVHSPVLPLAPAASRASRRTGATLVEVLIANALLSLLFLGAISLFAASAQQALKADAAGSSATEAANALEHLTRDTREALWCSLPDDAAGFTPPPGVSVAAFEVAGPSGTLDAGVALALPAAASSGLGAYDRSAPATATLWIYRSDADGTPDAQAGTCLWMQGTEQGQAVNRAVLTSVAASPSAVQFRRPTDAAGNPLPYQVQVKLVSAHYSRIAGQQSSEATDGTLVTPTAGACVLLRDHELGLDHEPASSGGSGGNAGATLTN